MNDLEQTRPIQIPQNEQQIRRMAISLLTIVLTFIVVVMSIWGAIIIMIYFTRVVL